MNLFHDTFDTRFGPFSVAFDENRTILASAFGGRDVLQTRIRLPLTGTARSHAVAREQILAYGAGERREFTLAIAPSGTPFQQSVWSALRAIPFGATRSYAQLATELALPRAARAVGRANATNPICLLVPCHRVIGADGALTGFAFGQALKRALLDHEAAVLARAKLPRVA